MRIPLLPAMLLCLALVLALMLPGCRQTPEEPPGQPADSGISFESSLQTEVEPLKIKSFSFSHSGMNTQSCYSYTVTRTEDGTRLEASLNAGNSVVDTTVSEPVLDQLGELAGRFRLETWDGFSGVNSMALDGEDFTLSVTLESGETIYARGSNSFPQNYYAVTSEIESLFRPLIDEYGNLYPKTLESDELDYVMLSLNRQVTSSFFVNTYAKQNGQVSLEITVENYPGLEDLDGFHFYGTYDSFPFAEFQDIVRRYGMSAWNGWEKSAENYNECEWFQMNLGYASGESIAAMGTLYPENYEAAKSEILELLGSFILENADALAQ